MTTSVTLPLVFEVCIQSAFLFTALWIIVRLRKLNANIFALLASAIVTCVAESLVDYYVGVILATLIAVPILITCVTFVTRAERYDIGVTVGVSYGLLFLMNLSVLGTLMGDLKVSARLREEADMSAARVAARSVRRPATNAPSSSNPAETPATAPASARFALKGITQGGNHSTALIRYGTQTYSISVGQLIEVQTPTGPFAVTCKSILRDRVVLDVSGHEETLTFN